MSGLSATAAPMTLAASTWSGHDTMLLVWAVVAIAVIVVLITVGKVHPFISLITGTAVLGLTTGLDMSKVVEAFTKGVGDTLGNVGILVALGAILGKLLADSGGAQRIVDTMIGRIGNRAVPWMMALVAALLGIPMFFEVGLVLLMPVIFLVSRRVGGSILKVGIPAMAGLSVLHGLIPPHPGPLLAISALHADLGKTLMFGLLVAIPTVIIAGPVYGLYISRHVQPQPPQRLMDQFTSQPKVTSPPSFPVALGTVLLPVALMLFKTVIDLTVDDEDAGVRTVADFIGDPMSAMFLAVVVAMFTFGYLRGFGRQQMNSAVGDAFLPVATVIMVIGGGGGFKEMLVETGIGDAIGKATQHADMSPILLAWLVAVAIRLATGSATVATVTASGIMAPLMGQLHDVNAPLVALAVGSGSLFFSHVNDAGFWLVKEYLGMSVGETIKTWSVMETIISVVSFGGIYALSTVV